MTLKLKTAFWVALSSLAGLSVTVGGVAAQSGCETVDGPRCYEKLPTGIEMSYLEVGPKEGPAVILIHGLTDNVRSWSTTMASLHEINPELHIFAVDLRGHGRSSMPDAVTCAPAPENCFRPADFAHDIVAFMQSKGIEKAELAGHSLGSFIVQEVALTHPGMVAHAILDASAVSGVGNVALADYVLKEPIEGSWRAALEAKGKSYPVDFYELTPADADAKVGEWLAANWVVDSAADPAFLVPYIPETASVKLGTWIGATKALLSQDNTERLKEMSVPTMVMWGLQDSIFVASDQEAIKGSLAVAAKKFGQPIYFKEYGSIPLPESGFQESDIGHNIQWSAYETIAKDINAFITTDKPTNDLVHSDAAPNVQNLIVVPDKAFVEMIGE
ncbi:alpha/beta fold hydrolase [Mesorhizobium sp. NBSH29]|uniref:alpha/beta fold hydrolase n=1 Tax=Mesorhizobium sp. NBSH29 TaxID=2654249 RepID=UPI00189691FF|nr:alpha/beta hydrolase [Mesorhizobium sp. NBSH29]QPC86066.1 alpha/beta fold hydrolase [Mesorhizobium sp. NBSH29]